MVSLAELLLYSIVNYIPYTILALYPFICCLRFSKSKTVLIFSTYLVLTVLLFTVSYYVGHYYHIVSTYIITILSVVFYFITVKSQKRRMLFNLFMIKNTANCVVIVGKYLESVFFPNSIGTIYHWTNSLCMLIIMIPLSLPIVHIINKYFTRQIRESIDISIWKFLWLVPVFFYGIWSFIYYMLTDLSPLNLALTLESSVFILFFLAGQMLTYICIAKLVINFNEKALLSEENHRLIEQSLQYKCVNNQIDEVRRIKHDLRHQAIMINHLIEEENFDRLKGYLQTFIDSVPNLRLSYCQNASLNMLLVYYTQKCQERHIQFIVDLKLPGDLNMSDSDILIIFGNAVENAFDACCTMIHNNPYIMISGALFQGQFVFTIQNTYDHEIRHEHNTGELLSTKHTGSAIGITSIRSIVSKYNGTSQFSTEDNIFRVVIFIPAANTRDN